MKIVFMGTPEFAKTALEALVQAGYEVPLVITQPDKPKGRKYVMTPSEVKAYALSAGLRVETPNSMRTPEAEAMLRQAIVIAAEQPPTVPLIHQHYSN